LLHDIWLDDSAVCQPGNSAESAGTVHREIHRNGSNQRGDQSGLPAYRILCGQGIRDVREAWLHDQADVVQSQ